MTFRGVPDKIRLVCTSCGSEREVEDRPVAGVPLVEWWRSRGERCTPCFDRGGPPLPDPTETIPLPSGAGHPDTSRKAAELAAPRAGSQRAGSQRALLLDMAQELGEIGMTAYQAAVTIDRSPNQTATRMQELREQGWLEYKLDEHGNRMERPTTPGPTGLIQVMTAAGMEAWTHTGFAGMPGGAPLPATGPDRPRRKRAAAGGTGDTGKAMKMLRKAGLLAGAVEISPGLAERLLRLRSTP